VVHWQEGNTISARIFPCTQNEERKFKIGFTSPLPEREGKVVYKNITFRGPNPLHAKETVRVRFIGKPDQLQIPSGFKKNKKGEYFRENSYDPDLAITFSATPIRSNQFSFDGFTYTITPYQPEMQSVKFSRIFLDLNNSWSKNEIEELRSLINKHQVYVYSENGLIKLDNSNWDDITSDLLNRNFSLFPFHKITDENSSLVISKGKELSPHLKDFKESPFAKKVSCFFEGNHKVKLYNIVGGVSTYVSSFRELRGLEFAEGDIGRLKNLLQNNQFPKVEESSEKIILHDSQLMVRKSKIDSASLINTAPDHLARLFAYNDIMRKVGASYFNDDFINDELVNEAISAYVVSPVSSLIVLETKEDYDRFGIKDSDNSLHNASKQSSGAVPEPHEWALIIVFALLILYSVARRYQLKVLR
jgi:XrtN system VIT domain protein